jgi:hypothetical protein
MDPKENSPDESNIFRIKIAGQLHEKWAHWLNGKIIKIHERLNDTIIIVAVPDQSALRGVLNKLWDLNLTIISVTQQEKHSNLEAHHEY